MKNFPPPWNKLEIRQKVLLMRAICPNAFVAKVLPALISSTLGQNILDKIAYDLSRAHVLSSMANPSSPILVLLNSTSSKDPLPSIMEFYARWQRFYGGQKSQFAYSWVKIVLMMPNLLCETPYQMAIGLSYVTAIWFHSGCLS